MRISRIAFGIVFSATALFAQNAERPAFEVASIRPAPAGRRPRGSEGCGLTVPKSGHLICR